MRDSEPPFFPGSIQETSLLLVSGSLGLVGLDQGNGLTSSCTSETKLKCECKPSVRGLSVSHVLKLPFAIQNGVS